MKERPIIFSGEMVRAILDGRKTQTRRVVKPQPDNATQADWWMADHRCPYGNPGDLLWVRETWCKSPDGPVYRATEEEAGIFAPDDEPRWTPSIYMPRWASRITLRVTGVRVDRVRRIGPTDAVAEGIAADVVLNIGPVVSVVDRFADLWDSINAKRGYGWGVNPWVWVVEFERAPDAREI